MCVHSREDIDIFQQTPTHFINIYQEITYFIPLYMSPYLIYSLSAIVNF